MEIMKAAIFDLDNTLVDRTATFTGFARSFTDTYFQHITSREGLTVAPMHSITSLKQLLGLL